MFQSHIILVDFSEKEKIGTRWLSTPYEKLDFAPLNNGETIKGCVREF